MDELYIKTLEFSLILEEMAIQIAKVGLSACSLHTEDVGFVEACRFA